jgi:CRP-like cAMP-binding protein
MSELLSRKTIANHLLTGLADKDFGLLAAHLERVDLPVRKSLERRNKRITSVYFPESGFASVVAKGAGRQGIEVGIIGREGMTGLSLVLGASRPPRNETFIQCAGTGLCLTAARLREAIDQSVPLHRCLLRYAHDFQAQTAETALANGRAKIEDRLARWLLMADDRVDGPELPLTHEFLSLMLGAQRGGVTLAVHALERAGLISTRRAKITIVDRKALEKKSNGTYTPQGD